MRYLAILVVALLAVSCNFEPDAAFSASIRVDNRAPFEVMIDADETFTVPASTVSAYVEHVFYDYEHSPQDRITILAKAGDAPYASYGTMTVYPDGFYTIRVVYDPLAECYAIMAVED